MADGVFNIAKGRVVEYYNRVKSGDPAGSELNISLFTGVESDANLTDFNDMTAILAGALSEATFDNYVRIQLAAAGLLAFPAPDDANNKYNVDLDNQTWPLAGSAGGGVNNALKRMVICYDALGTNVDANLLPLCFFDFSVTTDGTNLIAQFDAAGFFSAT